MPEVPPAGVAPMPPPGDPPAAPAAPRQVGGHVGFATPIVTVNKDKTTTIGDQFTVLVPIGLGFPLGKGWVFDAETVVATPAHPHGTTGLVVDPGVVYDTGAVALGVRLAFQINADANVGLIPLIHKGVVDLGGGTGFIEAAFPTFVDNNGVTFNAVAHIGVGF